MDSQGKTWGKAYKTVGSKQIDACLKHLGLRECALGGYTYRLEKFYERDPTTPAPSATPSTATVSHFSDNESKSLVPPMHPTESQSAVELQTNQINCIERSNITTFQQYDDKSNSRSMETDLPRQGRSPARMVLFFLATPDNKLWLGDKPTDQLAEEVINGYIDM